MSKQDNQQAVRKAARISKILDRMDAPRAATPRKIHKGVYLAVAVIETGHKVMKKKKIQSFSALITEAIEFYADAAEIEYTPVQPHARRRDYGADHQDRSN